MKKSLFDPKAAETIINRVQELKPDAPNRWGEMNATEMLLHCNSCNREILQGARGSKKTTAKQYLLRILALYLAPHFKKGIKSESHHITKGKIEATHFEEEKNNFINLIQEFSLTKKELTLTHPAFGNISTNEWGIAAYKHMDHHLRQFGV
ncbi:MAG: DUF1569 domain-containing protein [Ferruginibacter sp.]